MIWEALIHTPWWVYLLFLYLLKVGFDATKTRVVSLKKLFILPSIFLAISINSLITSFRLSPSTIGVYLFSLLFGIGGGWLLVRNVNLKFDLQRVLIQLPGNWTTLILIMVIFSTKYYFGYSLAVDPMMAEDTSFELLMLSLSGVCTGLFLGRLTCYFFWKRSASHYELEPDSE